MAETIRAARGSELSCKGWPQEAALRMLMNNLDPDVAERPQDLVVYGGTGKAARSWPDYHAIVRELRRLENDETLLVQSGRPVGVFRTHEEAPRVLIANSNLVGKWATWEHFRELEKKGLMMYGQMTAGSWIYIGSQGIVQGTFETFAAAGRTHFGSDLAGRFVLSGGLGGMGGAQPLAATMAGGVFLGVEVDASRIQKRVETKYIDKMTHSYEEAIEWVQDAMQKGETLSVGLVMDAGEMLEKLLHANIIPHILTDQTSAHDPLNGYIPNGLSLTLASVLRKTDPAEYKRLSLTSMARHVGLMLQLQKRGAVTFDYGNNLREFARQGGEENAFDFPGFTPAYIRPLFCEGKGPFRWVALSGDPEDIYTTDRALMEAFPENKPLINWLEKAQQKISFQGLPARICWLGTGDREKAGLLFNNLVKTGKVKGPIVIGRDHLDCGSVASPNRETESMKDGSDAVSDWPLLNLMANTAGGATWVSFHHGGGVGMGYSQHAGMVVLADGTERAATCLKRVLHNDPSMGIFRHADAGYDKAKEWADKFDLNVW